MTSCNRRPQPFARNASAIAAILCIFGGAVHVSAQFSADQKKQAGEIQTAVSDAGKHYLARDFEKSAESIATATEKIRGLVESGPPELFDALVPSMKRIEKAHSLLQLEGVSLPPLDFPKRPEAMASKPETPKPAAPRPAPTPRRPVPPKTPAPDPSAVSFTSTVAPILVSRCGQCHVSGNRGGFQMTSYATLMKGPQEGVVVFPGDVIGSRLIETIETGDMPRGGGKVAPAELNMLKMWVAQGAKFDGADPNATFGGAAAPGADAAAAAPMTPVRRATGKETVSFAGDVAPLLLENCNGCHIDAMQTRGGLQMNTFAQLLRGGDSGSIVTPGNGAASLLVKKLRGMEGDRMPAGGRPALAEESIALISKWIDEGATLDGASENQPLSVMSQLAWVAKATPEEVTARRGELAQRHMTLVNAGGAPVNQAASDHFVVVGTSSTGTMKVVAEKAEEMLKQTKTLVAGPDGEGYFHGKVTVFVLPRRYDYSEFAKMVEQRGIPASWNSHWQFDGVNAYVAMVASDRDEPEVLAERLLAPITSVAVATRGIDVPHWFAEGIGIALVARQKGGLDRDARKVLEAEIYEATTAMGDAKKFLEGKLSPEQADRIGAALATTMIDRSRRRQFDGVLKDLETKIPFEMAFQKSFGVPMAEYIDTWLKWVRG